MKLIAKRGVQASRPRQSGALQRFLCTGWRHSLQWCRAPASWQDLQGVGNHWFSFHLWLVLGFRLHPTNRNYLVVLVGTMNWNNPGFLFKKYGHQIIIVICGSFLPMPLMSEPLSVHWAQELECERPCIPFPILSPRGQVLQTCNSAKEEQCT